ncbi:hypothetical protein EUX98_g8462 [Antrodiella citrinella]|uniref:Uncharacterized protein n=1 Tax=Antrodiella citrinella TaxID=2447956 RepID=A0A4S4M6Y7_9APHY|nr:hypothetical protein EUX98_g8462 [Antrodiella citrinella]
MFEYLGLPLRLLPKRPYVVPLCQEFSHCWVCSPALRSPSGASASEYKDNSEVDPVDVELGELSEADGPTHLAGVFGRYRRYPVLGEPSNEEQGTSSDESGSEGGEVVSVEAGAEVGAEVADGEEESSEDEDNKEEGGEEESGEEEGDESRDSDDEEEDGSGED